MKKAAAVFRRADKLSFMPSSKEGDRAGFQEIFERPRISAGAAMTAILPSRSETNAEPFPGAS
jgi:hypothetical protein